MAGVGIGEVIVSGVGVTSGVGSGVGLRVASGVGSGVGDAVGSGIGVGEVDTDGSGSGVGVGAGVVSGTGSGFAVASGVGLTVASGVGDNSVVVDPACPPELCDDWEPSIDDEGVGLGDVCTSASYPFLRAMTSQSNDPESAPLSSFTTNPYWVLVATYSWPDMTEVGVMMTFIGALSEMMEEKE